MTTPNNVEFTVHSSTENNQNAPNAAAFANGNYIVTWMDPGEDGSFDIRAQIFKADGTPDGSEMTVNTTTVGNQSNPVVAVQPSGAFAISWSDVGNVKVQFFDPQGQKLGGETPVNTLSAGFQSNPSIVSTGSGRYVVAWDDTSKSLGDASLTAVFGTVFESNGEALRTPFMINSTTTGHQRDAALTATDNGFLATWTDGSQTGGDTSQFSIRAQEFILGQNATEKAGAEIVINSTTALSQQEVQVATLADGNRVVIWKDNSGSVGTTTGFDLKGQLFDSAGEKLGAEFLVNTTTEGNQGFVSVTGLLDGGFVAVWQDNSNSADDPEMGAVRAQVFDRNGAKSGGEFLVNSTTALAQGRPHVVALADGRVLVTFESMMDLETNVTDIRAKFLSLASSSLPQLVNGTTGDDHYVGRDMATEFRVGAGHDTVEGGSGHDTLYGEDGNDLLDGGAGDDVIYGGAGNDALNGGDGDDILRDDEGLNTFHGHAGNDYVIASTADDMIYGDDGNDKLFGNGGKDLIVGGEGDDTVSAGDGVVRYQFVNGSIITLPDFETEGDATLRGEGGNDSVTAFNGADELYGGLGNDTLTSGKGDDSLFGEDGADSLTGGAGHDLLDGGVGADQMTGGDGNDIYLVDDAGDLVTETATGGTDEVQTLVSLNLAAMAFVEKAFAMGNAALTLTGSALNNTLGGNIANNLLDGRAGNDALSGVQGDDTLIGAGGADTLLGGAGADRLTGGVGADSQKGGTGADVFVFANAAAARGDRIADFRHGVDKLDLSAFMDGGKFIGAKAFSGLNDQVRYVRADGVLQGDVNGDGRADWTLTLDNKAALTASDFLF